MKSITAMIVALMMTIALQGCSSTGTAKTATGTDAAAAKGRAAGAGTDGGPEIGRYGGRGSRGVGGDGNGSYGDGTGAGGAGSGNLNDPSSPLSRRVIYFEYDSYDVLPEYVSIVNAHANYLASNSGRSVTLEGHADERGSSEYNIALGEQRARAVAKLMTLQGVSEEQIQIVSFGEEKPSTGGHDESSWQQNRRVEITYAGQ